MLSAALGYAGAGIRVFPVNANKEPLAGHGFHDATVDRGQIEAWWTRWPEAGIATPDFDAVDVDLYKPECEETWSRIRPLIPTDTPQHKTGGGGLQFLFKAGTLKDGRIGPGVDNRYAGRNYIILPPSLHTSGKRYEVVVSLTKGRLRPAPDFPRTSGSSSELQEIREQIAEGKKILNGRNKAAWAKAVEILRLVPASTDRSLVRDLVQDYVNKNCAGNLAEVNVEKQVRGAAVFVEKERERSPRRLQASAIADISMRSIEWLEKPLWQKSAFELLAGAKGSGKGTYLAGLASRVTRSGANVIFLSTEDSVQIDLKPRLVAAGAIIERCYCIEQHVLLPGDIDELQALAGDVGNVGLLVIDPVANHIGDRNSNSDAEVRNAIAPLNGLANELDCLLIGVRHPGKDRSRGALASILGSTAWVDTPRAVVMVAVDDEDPLVRHVQVVAGNRSLNGTAQAFRIDAVELEGLSEPITLAVQLGESEKSVEDLMEAKPAGSLRVASELVQDTIVLALETGEKSRAYLDQVCADELGVNRDAVYKRGLSPLREAARIRARKESLTGGWFYQLQHSPPNTTQKQSSIDKPNLEPTANFEDGHLGVRFQDEISPRSETCVSCGKPFQRGRGNSGARCAKCAQAGFTDEAA